MSNLQLVTLKIPRELVETLDNLAMRKGVSRSEIIRRAVIHYIRHENNTKEYQPRIVVIG